MGRHICYVWLGVGCFLIALSLASQGIAIGSRKWMQLASCDSMGMFFSKCRCKIEKKIYNGTYLSKDSKDCRNIKGFERSMCGTCKQLQSELLLQLFGFSAVGALATLVSVLVCIVRYAQAHDPDERMRSLQFWSCVVSVPYLVTGGVSLADCAVLIKKVNTIAEVSFGWPLYLYISSGIGVIIQVVFLWTVTIRRICMQKRILSKQSIGCSASCRKLLVYMRWRKRAGDNGCSDPSSRDVDIEHSDEQPNHLAETASLGSPQLQRKPPRKKRTVHVQSDTELKHVGPQTPRVFSVSDKVRGAQVPVTDDTNTQGIRGAQMAVPGVKMTVPGAQVAVPGGVQIRFLVK